MTDDGGGEPNEGAGSTQSPVRRLGRLDPGWATAVAAALALVGTLATLFFSGSSNDPRALTPVVDSPTATTESPTSAATATTAPTPTPPLPTATSIPPEVPLVALLSALPADQREVMNAVSVQLLAAADTFPLIVNDEFANNDYAWPLVSRTFDGGSQCSWTMDQGAYEMAVQSVNGPAYCEAGLSKVAADFVLSIEQRLRDGSNSEIGLLFRYVDEQNHYALVYNPQTQTMWLSHVGPNGASPILLPTYIAEINRTGPNQITVLAIGSSMMVYANETIVVMISNESRILSPGRILVREWLNEPNANEVLSLTRFELRGE